MFSLTREYDFKFQTEYVQNLDGFVVSEISKSEKLQTFVFEQECKSCVNNCHSCVGRNPDLNKILIKTDKYFEYSYGDKISISGTLEIPENFENDNGITFNYRSYLLKDGITHSVFYPDIKLLEKESKKDFKFYILKLKENLISESQKIFKLETNSLTLGVLLGVKDSINPDLEENFRRTGLIHVLVLSGFNLTIIAYFIFKLLSNFHRNIRYILSLVFILIFTIMVGAGATIVRAGIMISLFIISKLFYRNSNPINTLLLAGSSMIFVNPMILLYDPSFQLSFLATLGLVSFYPVIEKLLYFLPNKFSIKEIIISNIAVQITVIPLLTYMMGEFSVISLIPNILVLPFIPIFMLTSFVSILLSYLPIFLFSFIPILITEKLSEFIIFFVNYFGSLSFSVAKVGVISPQLLLSIIFFYIFIILILDLRKKIISKLRYSYLQF